MQTLSEKMAIDILDIFNNHIRHGYSYCYICLRTAKEVRLVQPQFSKNLAGIFNRIMIFDDVNANKKTVCYLCEKASRAACRLYAAFTNAIESKQLINTLRRSRQGMPLSPFLQQAARESNTQLQQFRTQTTLKQTEVLIIDSLAGQSNIEVSGQSSNKESKKSTAKTKATISNFQHTNTEFRMLPLDDATVIIEDDDEVQIVNPLEDQAIEEQERAIEEIWLSQNAVHAKQQQNNNQQGTTTASTSPIQQRTIGRDRKQRLEITTKDNNESQEQDLIISMESDPNHVMPKIVSIDVFLKTKGQYIAARMPGNQKLIVRSPEDSENCIIHNIVQMNNIEYVPTLCCELTGTKLLYKPTMFKNAPVIELRPVSSKDSVTASNVVILPEPTENQNQISISDDDDKEAIDSILEQYLIKMTGKRSLNYPPLVAMPSKKTKESSSNPIAVISDVKSMRGRRDAEISEPTPVVKKPMEKSESTDWEDKIPMDVISFVDPDAEMLILPD